MAPTSNVLRAARPAFRSQQFFTGFRQNAQRRWQSSASSESQESFLKRMWNSPVGLKTVHFWAPIMKWGLVLAGISDFARPAEKLSLTQNAALTATGLIWTRWCLIIKPRNLLLAAVNFFLGGVGIVQVSRILMWQQSQKGLPEAVEQVKEEVKEEAKEVKKAVKV